MTFNEFKYKVGMVGDPILPEVEWSDEQMALLKDMGMNFAQLNIAWDSRPKNEPLNLDDMTDEVVAVFKKRVAVLKKFSMKGMLHFGLPKVKVLGHEANITQYITPACIMEKETLVDNTVMMEKLMYALPDVDEYMFYTYDQHAWLCSEFGNCPNCAGVSLDKRLPQFINQFKAAAAKINPGFIFWWQPWELSLGQICETLNGIEPANFGLMLNTGGAESYFNNLDNYWIRCISVIAAEKNVPIIGEIQTAGSGVGAVPLSSFPCPTLVYRQISIVRRLPTFVGIKEHFGYPFSKTSCNMLFSGEYLKDTEASLEELLRRTAAYYGDKATPYLVEAWTKAEQAYDFIPFAFTYLYSNIAGYPLKHDFNVPKVEGVYADTPAWESDRRAYFLNTHGVSYHPWALEDAALRFKQSGTRFRECHALLTKALGFGSSRREDLERQCSDMLQMAKANLGQYYYFKEALLAFDARTALFQRDEDKFGLIVAEFEEILKLDMLNQGKDKSITEKHKEFLLDKKLFFHKNFKQDEKYFASGRIEKIDQRY